MTNRLISSGRAVSSCGWAMGRGIATVLAVISAGLVMAACGGGEKSYDIAPIFPLSSGKCAKYHGDQEGSGMTESCMVTKDECERATADWQETMQDSGVNDALEFSCG